MPMFILDHEELKEKLADMDPAQMILDALECRIGYALQIEEDPAIAMCYVMLLQKMKEEMTKEGVVLDEDEHDHDGHQVRGARA